MPNKGSEGKIKVAKCKWTVDVPPTLPESSERYVSTHKVHGSPVQCSWLFPMPASRGHCRLRSQPFFHRIGLHCCRLSIKTSSMSNSPQVIFSCPSSSSSWLNRHVEMSCGFVANTFRGPWTAPATTKAVLIRPWIICRSALSAHGPLSLRFEFEHTFLTVTFRRRTEFPQGIAGRKDGGDCSGSGEVDPAVMNIHTLSVLSLHPVVDPTAATYLPRNDLSTRKETWTQSRMKDPPPAVSISTSPPPFLDWRRELRSYPELGGAQVKDHQMRLKWCAVTDIAFTWSVFSPVSVPNPLRNSQIH